jgi:ATP-dependent Clp protease ATP-binding subunit ClpA
LKNTSVLAVGAHNTDPTRTQSLLLAVGSGSCQVLLAVDDSRSMVECGAGGMALEAVTLLAKALARLEVRCARAVHGSAI